MVDKKESDADKLLNNRNPTKVKKGQNKLGSPKLKSKNKYNNMTYGIAILVVLIIIIVIAVAAYYNTGVYKGNVTLSIGTSKGIVYSINNSEYSIYLYSTNSKSNTADVYITKSPIFINKPIEVNLPVGTLVHINTSGKYANLIIKMTSVSSDNATLNIYPVSPSLGISPDYSHITYNATFG
ncbi:membrane protein [Candidatus Mancarchaeum acidiphilum]|uniref:Membrane protein n=1 Tax=Candidatus Mancarchaeum acidiphilum TaxID=1920749 RepID=A0A218NLW4_9ARCH|nr:hypothetical protein [Candidatus Mancarchaeum acidiphilum]ASI13442.1 membrane protein [Candidatus Mancarchaeum acidiphilum]